MSYMQGANLVRTFTDDGLPVLTKEEQANGWTPESLKEYWHQRRKEEEETFLGLGKRDPCPPPATEYDPKRY